MENPKFELFQAVRNTINKSLGVVIKAAGDNVTVQLRNGDRLTFRAQYLEPAPPEEAEALRGLAEALRQDSEAKARPRDRIVDPLLIRAEFEKFVKHIAARYPKSAEAFGLFWKDLMAAIGDEPGKTWEMKPNSSRNPGPVIKAYNRATDNWVQCMTLQAGWGLRIEMKKEYIPQAFEGLFPITHAMFGAGRAAEITYDRFPPEKRASYAACLKAVYEAAGRPA